METSNTKQIKIHAKFRRSQSQLMSESGKSKIVPWLTVSGVWLEKLGFNIGDMVNITSSNNRIIIESVAGNAVGDELV